MLSRRRKAYLFECVTSIVFCADLADYDRIDDYGNNRLTESIALFDSIVNSRWFLRSSIILCLTKIDLFKEKIQNVPLERYFPDYEGDADINNAARYILLRYMKCNHAKLSVYPQYASRILCLPLCNKMFFVS